VIFREIGLRIQQAREESCLTQEELAERLGCTQPTLSNYELGKRRLYLNLLNEIARVLNKPLDYFMHTSEQDQGDGIEKLLLDPQLKEMLISAASLPAKERNLVQDFINWRKNQK